MSYDLKSFKLPRLGDRTLRSVVAFLENPLSRRLLEPSVLKETGVQGLREAVLNGPPTFLPRHPRGRSPSAATARSSLDQLDKILSEPDRCAKAPTARIVDYATAYRQGTYTPDEMAGRVTQALQQQLAGEDSLNAVIVFDEPDIRHQAAQSTARFARGAPLSLLDGVPVAVKDELDALPYATTGGSQVYGQEASATEDATVVARLRAAGAIIIGKANMHEIGVGVTGNNVTYGYCRNPHAPDHYPGGSSSGSAAAVAAGLCPLAVGADGGGSIRIPAALCGIAGLKATYGRVSSAGALPLCWSVGHMGPMGNTVEDVAIGYMLMAGADAKDRNTADQPPVHLQDFWNDDLKGLRIGVYEPWFNHANREIVDNCRAALDHLESRGAQIVQIEVDGLELQRVAHAVSITSEMLTSAGQTLEKDPSLFGDDSRMALALARFFSSTDYLRAQQVRTRALATFDEVFTTVDMIATPTTGIPAPAIRARRRDVSEASLTTMTDLMRFAFSGNLTGLPALSVPVQTTLAQLPVGFQLMGRAWEEHLLLRTGRVLQAISTRNRPRIAFDLSTPIASGISAGLPDR